MSMRLWLLLFYCLSLSSCGHGRAGKVEAISVVVTPVPMQEGEIAPEAKGVTIKARGMQIDVPAGNRVSVNRASAQQPTPADEPASVAVSSDGAEADSGNGGKTPASYGLAGTMWVGIGLIIVGGILFLAKRAGMAAFLAPAPTKPLLKFAAMLPKGTGILVACCGAALIVLPFFLATIEPVVIPVTFVCLILLGLWGWNTVKNRGKDNVQETT